MWYCPFCAPIIDLDANMERILAARPLLKVVKRRALCIKMFL